MMMIWINPGAVGAMGEGGRRWQEGIIVLSQ